MRIKSLAMLIVAPVLFLMAVGPASALAETVVLNQEGTPLYPETRLSIAYSTLEFGVDHGGAGACDGGPLTAELSENNANPLTINGVSSESENKYYCWYLGGGEASLRNLEIPGQIALYPEEDEGEFVGEMPISFEIHWEGAESYCRYGATISLRWNPGSEFRLTPQKAPWVESYTSGYFCWALEPYDLQLWLRPVTLEDGSPTEPSINP